MPSYSHSTVMGHIGRVGDLRKTDTTSILTFTVAVNSGYGDKEKTHWHRVVCFGKTAEYVSDRGEVGELVLVIGEHRPDSYEKEDGTRAYTCDLVANRVLFTKKKNKEDKPAFSIQENDTNDNIWGESDDISF